jgi:SNF2 family DNA or RNA helicase
VGLFDRVVEVGNHYKVHRFPVVNFQRRLAREYGTIKIGKLITAIGLSIRGYRTIVIHKFFVPELIYLLRKFDYPNSLINAIIENTWLNDCDRTDLPGKINMALIAKYMDVELLPHQAEYVANYSKLKHQHQLNGMILSFDQGLGKTLTALAVMVALSKNKVIVFAPKSTLHTVWEHHIKTFFKKDSRIYIAGTTANLSIDYDFYLFNYEAMEKIKPLIKALAKYNTGIIVDESHNFLRMISNRTALLIELRKSLTCEDILMLSGTPLKAVGSEIIPMLHVLDKYFDDAALATFKSALGVNTSVANDILHARLSTMMYRKVKENVVTLPSKTELTYSITIPNGKLYTIDSIKIGAKLFYEGRMKYHATQMHIYLAEFKEVMEYLESATPLRHNNDFHKYLKQVEWLRKHPVSSMDPGAMEIVKWVNKFEKNEITPLLPKDLAKKFKHCKAAVKYVHLKVQGEVLGQYLMAMRIKMTSAMVEHSKMEDLVNDALKKTIVFSSYIDTVGIAYDYLVKKGFTPLLLHGNTKESAKDAVTRFRANEELNPFVASVNMLVTGVTLIEANTVLFLNKPFRYTDYLQASDRIHRIGQDTPCFIYTLLLETGSEGNLSTRMEDIMMWSKDQFIELVGDGTE